MSKLQVQKQVDSFNIYMPPIPLVKETFSDEVIFLQRVKELYGEDCSDVVEKIKKKYSNRNYTRFEYRLSYEDTCTCGNCYCDVDSELPFVYVYGYRPETDKEYERRLKREVAAKEKEKKKREKELEKERRVYEKLKRKFENEDM